MHGFGSAALQDAQNAKAVWPSCWGKEVSECVLNKSDAYPGCATIRKWRDSDGEGGEYDKLVDSTPFCPQFVNDSYSINTIHAILVGGGLLVGLILGKLIF